MKKVMVKSSTFFMILMLCCISIIGNSQDFKLNRKEKKEAEKAERLKDYESVGDLLESGRFVYESDRAQGSTGAKVYNVIQVDGSRIAVRCEDPKNTSGRFSGALDNSTPASSPRTGIFFEGDIVDWKISMNPKTLSYSVRCEATNEINAGTVYEITIKVSANKSAGIEIKSQAGGNIYTNYSGLIRAL